MPVRSADMPPPVGGLPLRIGAVDDFARVRGFLQAAEFNEATICRVTAIAAMNDLDTVPWDRVGLEALPAALRWCIAVLLRGTATAETEALRICGEPALAALIALGLLRPARHRAGWLVCPVWLYPVDGFVAASDRRTDPDGEPHVTPDDIVFPGIYRGTLQFLRLMPDAQGGDALDLCGGCGIGALHLARSARAAVTSDVTQRSAFFAAFNAALNGVAAESLCGDMYAPVAGRQFDVITAHPPFVPASGQRLVFRDAGDTGEDIVRRTIEGLPAHLRPGGIAMVVCTGRETHEQTFEQRVQAWLGAAAAEFEIVFGFERLIEVDDIVATVRARAQPGGAEDAEALRARLLEHGTRQFVYGALFLRRHATALAEQPLRVRMSEAATGADFARLLDWRRQRRHPDFPQRIATARPRLAPQFVVTARHVVAEGQLVADEFMFRAEGALPSALRAEAWMVPLMAGLDGRRSLQEVYQAARADGDLPDGFAMADFARLVSLMVERGFLELAPE